MIEDNLEQFRIAAESGDKNAMCEYAWELVDHKKLSDAFKWFEMSKDLNDPDRNLGLGICYLFGKGTDNYIEEAINCFLRAVELGEIIGAVFIYHISNKYDEYVNFDEVVRIFEKLNNSFSTDNADDDYIKVYNYLRFILACCYYWGVGTEKDEEHAKKLLLSMDYDFDEDKTPLLIKESTMALPFPKRVPFCNEFLIPLRKTIFDILFNKKFSNCYSFLDCFNLSKYSKTKELYNFFKELDDKDREFYFEAVSVNNANYMRDALEEKNYHDFREACNKEPNFAGYVFFYNKFKKIIQFEIDPPFIGDPLFDIENIDSIIKEQESFEKNDIDVKTITKWEKLNCNILNNKEISTQIRHNNLQATMSIVMYYMIQEESENADNWIEYEKYLTLTKLLNQPKFSDEIYEFKRYCINTPEILDWLEKTKEELSSIFGIVDESSDGKLENINAKDVIIPDTYKCEIFDGCEEAYKIIFEKLKGIYYIDESTSFDSFKIAIGLVPKPEEGFFKRVIWKSMYGNRANWKPLLNMLRLIGIKREDLKPKTLNSLFVHSTGKKIDSNVIKVHKATALIEFNGKKQSIHKHLCDFLEKSGFSSDKLIHNLDE